MSPEIIVYRKKYKEREVQASSKNSITNIPSLGQYGYLEETQDSLKGLVAYIKAKNVKNKLKNPVSLALMFPSTFQIYGNDKIVESEVRKKMVTNKGPRLIQNIKRVFDQTPGEGEITILIDIKDMKEIDKFCRITESLAGIRSSRLCFSCSKMLIPDGFLPVSANRLKESILQIKIDSKESTAAVSLNSPALKAPIRWNIALPSNVEFNETRSFPGDVSSIGKRNEIRKHEFDVESDPLINTTKKTKL